MISSTHLDRADFPRKRRRPRPCEGFTLLEVILALVILAAALAMLSEVMQLATRHAVAAQAESQAQSLAASLMDQLIAGAIDITDVTRQALEVDDVTPWVYSVTVGTSDITGIAPVEVRVEQDVEPRFGPITFRLLRWLPTTLELPESAAGGPGPQNPNGQSPGGGSAGGFAPGAAGGPSA